MSAPVTRAHRRKRTILILSFLLVVLVAGGVAAQSVASSEDGEGAQDSLLGIEASQIVDIMWTTDGEESHITYEDNAWCDPDSPDDALDQTAAAQIAQAFADATTSRTIDAESKTDEMGLDEPTATATIALDDGTERTVTIGAVSQNTAYYATVDDGDIHLIDVGLPQALESTLGDLYEKEVAPQASDVDSLTVSSDDGTFTLTYYENGSTALSYTDRYTYFGDGGDGQRALDTNEAASLVDLVNEVSWRSCVDPSTDDAASYGLDDPTLTATLAYTEEVTTETGETDEDGNAVTETSEENRTYTLVVGSKAADGSYYAQPEGSTAVYTLSAETVESLLEASCESLEPDDVCLADWDAVESVEFAYDGTSRTISIEREEVTDDEGNTSVEETYYVDGEEFAGDSAEDALDAIDALTSEGEIDDGDESAGNSMLSITIRQASEAYPTVTLEFTEYDNSFYLVTFDDGAHVDERLLVNKNDIEDLKEQVTDL